MLRIVSKFLRTVVATLHLVSKIVARFWRRTSPLCHQCSNVVDARTIGRGEPVMWCSNCRRVIAVPLAKIPGWAAGVICVLTMKLMLG